MIQDQQKLRSRLTLLALAILALIAAAPALTGEFLVGDDRQLLLNHALVNHPTWENVVKLFSLEAQRDLYQPLPLLTFAAEFKLVRWLNLPLTNEGRGAATTLFHGTNVLLHVANVLLVYILVRRASSSTAMALFAAVLLAVHPLSVESYAWLNGRMTLLSVLFSLLALVCMQRLLERPSQWLMAGAAAAAVLAMCSKVRMELPFLVLMIPLIQKLKPRASWWIAFVAVLFITAAFAALNIATTAEEGMFEGAGKMEGSPWARTCITLGWYVRALVWPTALSPYYPTDPIVNWNHSLVPASALWIGAAALILFVSLRWTNLGLIGGCWFLVSVGPTLPLLPSRYLMAADRYVYLANIGLYVFVGWFCLRMWNHARENKAAQAACKLILAVLIAAGLVLSWRQAGYYHNDVNRYTRIAELNPDREGVWERLAWAYYDAGEYLRAIETAQKELGQDSGASNGRVDQLVGMSLNRLGRTQEAIQRLQSAVQEFPNDVKARSRLAKVLADSGETQSAILHYTKAVELNATFNPAVVQLADLLHKQGQFESAAHYYELALVNNAYDANAVMGLSEIDMARGAYAAAIPRLEALLKWMPHNVTARTNLGVCHAQLGRNPQAIEQYQIALQHEPGSPVASANLSLLLLQVNQGQAALEVLRTALNRNPTDTTVLIGFQDVCAATGKKREALQSWSVAAAKLPDSLILAGWLAWSAVLADTPQAESYLRPSQENPSTPMRLAEAFLLMRHRQIDLMVSLIRRMGTQRPADMPDALDRLMNALTDYGMNHADEVWPYYLIAEVLTAQGDSRAHAALEAFDQICQEPQCKQRADDLRKHMAARQD